jgi:ankyrin repeat protein
MISRIKEIYSSTDPVMDINLPSRQGDTLLKLCVSSYHLEEEDPDAQLDLVRFVLKCGANPNLEDSMGETALDWLLAHHFQCNNPLSAQHEEMILLLAESGALLHLSDSQGRLWGKRKFSFEDLEKYESRLCGNWASRKDR